MAAPDAALVSEPDQPHQCEGASRGGLHSSSSMSGSSMFEAEFLGRREANCEALTPLLFVERAANVFPNRTSVVHGELRYTWKETAVCNWRAAWQRMGLGWVTRWPCLHQISQLCLRHTMECRCVVVCCAL